MQVDRQIDNVLHNMQNKMDLNIRVETEKDFREVEELTREAFWDVYAPGCTEHFMLYRLRHAAEFIPQLSLVAETQGRIAGHIAYTHSYILHADGARTPLLCFGPVSVLPEYQGKGIGGALIRASFEKAKALGHKAVCIMGNPLYYRRFGFRCAERYDLQTAGGKYAAAMMALELQPGALPDKGGRVIESDVYALNDEPGFLEFDASFPPKEKGYKPSQDVFGVLVSMIYD